MMQAQWSRHWLRTTANLALFAMLAIWTSPALAWHCCCSPEAQHAAIASQNAAPQHHCCEEATPVRVVAPQDDCQCVTPQSPVAALPESPFHSQVVFLDFVSPTQPFVLTALQATTSPQFSPTTEKLRSRSSTSSRCRAPPTFWL